MLTLGSLFDGSGTCPLAATMCGVTPVWASEIEPFPVAVTKSRFPEMKHLGDIREINGAEIDPVDIITFGSPCQNLSMAGNRKGLEGEESSLFLEAVRIIREMRDATDGQYPQLAMWENVPGAFSSNSGADYQRVIEELCRICEPDISIPQPKKWARDGLVMGDSFSLGWRVLDAQHWGVPQRRKRIFLVLDLGGQCAGEILFVREGLSRDFTQSCRAGETAPGTAEDRPGEYDCNYAVENHPHAGRVRLESDQTVQTLNARMGTGGGNVPLIIGGFKPNNSAKAGGLGWEENRSPTITTDPGKTAAVVPFCAASTEPNAEITDGTISPTLRARAGTGGGMCQSFSPSEELPLLVRATGQANSEVGQNCAPTLNCTHEPPFVTLPICYQQASFSQYKVNSNSATLGCKIGAYGGGANL